MCTGLRWRGTGLLPERILERWLVEDGAMIQEDDALAVARIGDVLHDIVSSAEGHVAMMARGRADRPELQHRPGRRRVT